MAVDQGVVIRPRRTRKTPLFWRWSGRGHPSSLGLMLVRLYSAALFAATHHAGSTPVRRGHRCPRADVLAGGLADPCPGPPASSERRPGTSAGRYDAEASDFTECADHARSLSLS